jgi:hypothetical protein
MISAISYQITIDAVKLYENLIYENSKSLKKEILWFSGTFA